MELKVGDAIKSSTGIYVIQKITIEEDNRLMVYYTRGGVDWMNKVLFNIKRGFYTYLPDYEKRRLIKDLLSE